jgi:Polyketide cyclase / dehydrase and lipid transport
MQLSISAIREVPDTPERVYGFLSRLDNHAQLTGRELRLAALDADERGGRVVVAGPLGLRRTARTKVTTELEPHRFGGVATVGRRTRARVQWSIDPSLGGARVVLESTIASRGVVDGLLLALGGRWWLRRGFRRALDSLAEAVEEAPAAAPA